VLPIELSPRRLVLIAEAQLDVLPQLEQRVVHRHVNSEVSEDRLERDLDPMALQVEDRQPNRVNRRAELVPILR
jgi:hypothetical protein